MAPTIDERATGFFFTNYIVEIDSHSGIPAGYRIYDNLLICIKAVGLAGLSSAAHAPGLVQELSSGEQAYPINYHVAERIRNLDQWSSALNERMETHINGATALIKVRGPEKLASAAGVRLFLQATASLMVSCLGAGTALPEHILEMNTKVAKHTDLTDPLWRYYETMGLLTNFRAHIRCGFISDPRETLARALEIDRAALSICADALGLYEYETIYTDAEPELFPVGCYRVYKDYMAATIWNGMRTIKMMLQENVRTALLKLSSSTPPSSFIDEQYEAQYQTSTNTLYRLQSDIIASVPRHLGYATTKSIASGASTHTFPWSHFNTRAVNPFHSLTPNPAAPPMIRTFGGYSLPWALYVAGDVDITTVSVRGWVVGTLKRIGRSMGIQQAMVLADNLKEKHPDVVIGQIS